MAAPRRAGLDEVVGSLPADADCWFIHDLALAPAARGSGAGREILERLAGIAGDRGFAVMALVSVGDASAYWGRRGFVTVDAAEMAAKLAAYGPGARYMERRL